MIERRNMNRVSRLLGLIALASTGATAASAVTSERDAAAVRLVLSTYEAAVERLDLRGTEILFANDSEVYESGGQEGNYANYLAHHLTPELAEFKSFKFNDYKVSVRFEGPVALATETYKYRIETKKGEIAERFGVATSALKKVGNRWQIIVMHSSARRPSKA
jgi:ketosteroid isomerase-like protein